jgi:hypothetical protein
MSMQLTSSCLVCGDYTLIAVEGFNALPRITSDCRPFSAGGELFVCHCCGSVQKQPNKPWLDEIGQIYKNYAAYSLAGGEEQLVLDAETGRPQKRSEVLMRQLLRTGIFPESCKAIDVGCGHGVTLKAMSATFPDWQLFGHELGEGHAATLHGIPRFHHLYTGELAEIGEKFGFASMIHSLEHFADPLSTLKILRSKMQIGGYLFVEVCNVEENPFDLVVADHLMHFSSVTLVNIARKAGFTLVRVSSDWVKKELSLLAVAADIPSIEADPDLDKGSAHEIHGQVSRKVFWLGALIDHAEICVRKGGTFGLFGTSIAATWLASVLGDSVNFFVDEDPNRIGETHMGRPVLSPQNTPAGAMVFMPVAPALAVYLKDRLDYLIPNLVLPPLPSIE